MGEYLTKYSQIIEAIYQKDIARASLQLKELLNSINEEMMKEPKIEEKFKAKQAIITLLPVLNDLKLGVVSDRVITILGLDKSKLENNNDGWKELLDDKNKENKPIEDKKKETDRGSNKDVERGSREDEKNSEEVKFDNYDYREKNALIPKTLDDYIGQEKAKRILKVSIDAAKKEKRVLEHLLICSPYGLGKTTLAYLIAKEMKLPFFSINSTNLKDTKSLCLYFSKIKESCIIFVDEIHLLKNDVQTLLLSVLTDFRVSYIDKIGEEKTFNLPPFTLIGASTQAGELLKPLLNRFAILELEEYTDEEKEIITKSKFDKLGYVATEEAIKAVAIRGRGIPRTIETFVKGLRDIAISKDSLIIDQAIVDEYFELNNIDELGLNKNDLLILNVLKKANVPLALVTLSSKTGIAEEDLEFRYEPYLIKIGFIEKTERGRVISQVGIDYLMKDSEDNQ